MPDRKISDEDRRVGQAIKAAREAKGISQAKLAQAVGKNASYVGFIERGERRPPLGLTWRLAEVLELKPEQLLPEGALSPEEIEALTLLRSIPSDQRAGVVDALRSIAGVARQLHEARPPRP